MKKFAISAFVAAFAVSAVLCGCGDKNAAEEVPVVYSSDNVEVFDITRYDCPQYQWFIKDKSGNVIGSGVSEKIMPVIETVGDKISVFVSEDGNSGKYREFDIADGSTSEWLDCRRQSDGSKICFDYEIREFNFAEVIEESWDRKDGVNKNSFVNYEESPVSDENSAYERAKNEVAKKYGKVSFGYDRGNDMWAVYFKELEDGGEISVYLDITGVTRLIVTDKQEAVTEATADKT